MNDFKRMLQELRIKLEEQGLTVEGPDLIANPVLIVNADTGLEEVVHPDKWILMIKSAGPNTPPSPLDIVIKAGRMDFEDDVAILTLSSEFQGKAAGALIQSWSKSAHLSEMENIWEDLEEEAKRLPEIIRAKVSENPALYFLGSLLPDKAFPPILETINKFRSTELAFEDADHLLLKLLTPYAPIFGDIGVNPKAVTFRLLWSPADRDAPMSETSLKNVPLIGSS